jgi:hypothetical protein
LREDREVDVAIDDLLQEVVHHQAGVLGHVHD